MSRIRGKDTGPELQLRQALWRKGLRYRLQYSLPGKPDIAFVSKRLVVFVDGCFWHGCPLHSTMPETNKTFWREKIDGNMQRDLSGTKELQSLGWKVVRFWEHEIKTELMKCVAEVEKALDRVNE